MSAADLDKWQARYANEATGETPPEPFVLSVLPRLPAEGRALDIAGGLGRHAIELARLGLDTTLLDISPRGLERALERAEERGVSVSTQALDLDDAPLPPGPFDVILVTWFLLTEATWGALPDRLAASGHLLYVQPTLQNLDRHPRPSARFLVEPGALRRGAERAGLSIERHEIGWDERGHHTERLWARRGR